jgi:hypothetical protein
MKLNIERGQFFSFLLKYIDKDQIIVCLIPFTLPSLNNLV